MDFDDLDDAIEERVQEGDFASLEVMGQAGEKVELKQFVKRAGMGLMPRDHRLPLDENALANYSNPDRKHMLRVFLFYGPGGAADMYTAFMYKSPKWMELAVYEMPGHGRRYEEPLAANLDELAEDAFQAIKPAMDEVKAEGPLEGGPFAFIGVSIGTQLLTLVAKKVAMQCSIEPSCVVMMDRAPPQYPLFSETGLEKLKSDPNAVLKAVNWEQFDFIDKRVWINDLNYAAETKDPFLHKFNCNFAVLTAEKNKDLDRLGKSSCDYLLLSLKIADTDENLQLPVEVGTKVGMVLTEVGKIFSFSKGIELKAADESGTVLGSDDLATGKIVISGLVSFKHPRYTWPHPVCIIGTGFHGVKLGMKYMLEKYEDIVLIDRRDSAGGDAWHSSATKHSKVQTDFGAFNIWWGHEYTYTGEKGFGASPGSGQRAQFALSFEGTGAGTGVDYNPLRHQVLGQMQFAVKEYGLEDKCKHDTDVAQLQIIGAEDSHDRYYKLTLKSTKGGGNKFLPVSVIYHFPGAYDINRIVDYPGEKEFGGQIGYGMGNGQGGLFVWDDDRMKGARAAILGNGAFAVENVRSCAEHGASKVYLVTRRKNFACPRVPCWFCHQGPIPVPAWMLLDMFKPMYEMSDFGDPYKFHAVINNGPKNITISQSSRFGIGDVTFICHAYGLLEYRVDTLAKCSHKTLHLAGGEKLENMQHLIKALGLKGDPRVDKLHDLKYRQGNMINGDWRRMISADATGMHANNFTTFSAGPGACGQSKMWYWIHNHPWEVYAAMEQGLLKIIPKHEMSKTQPDQTIYMTNVQYEMAAGGLFGQYFPNLGRCGGDESSYKYSLIHSMHPTDKYLEYCKADWDRYQKLIRDYNGYTCDWKPYPYTREMVDGFFDEYNKHFNMQTSAEGPPEEFKWQCIETFKSEQQRLMQEQIPEFVKFSKLMEKCPKGTDPYALAWLSQVFPVRKQFMYSNEGSALDFDDEHYQEWRNWVAMEYECKFIKVASAKSLDIAVNGEAWGHIVPMLDEVRALKHHVE